MNVSFANQDVSHLKFKNELNKEVLIELTKTKMTGEKGKNNVRYDGVKLVLKSSDHVFETFLTYKELAYVVKSSKMYMKEYGKKSEITII